MTILFSEPDPSGCERAHGAKRLRDIGTEMSRLRPQVRTESNREEADHGPQFPANFIKGLAHDDCGLLENDSDYHCFVEAINSPNRNLFEKHVLSAKDHGVSCHCSIKDTCHGEADVEWRGWESPRAGHVYDLQGPDAGACGMAPAPRVGSSELAAEMAEVYALAILRDVPFTTICHGGAEKLCTSSDDVVNAELSASDIVKLLNGMPFYTGGLPVPNRPMVC